MDCRTATRRRQNWFIINEKLGTPTIQGQGDGSWREKGSYKYELMRKICTLGNARGGILIWGTNYDTFRIEEIKVN